MKVGELSITPLQMWDEFFEKKNTFLFGNLKTNTTICILSD